MEEGEGRGTVGYLGLGGRLAEDSSLAPRPRQWTCRLPITYRNAIKNERIELLGAPWCPPYSKGGPPGPPSKKKKYLTSYHLIIQECQQLFMKPFGSFKMRDMSHVGYFHQSSVGNQPGGFFA